MGRRNNEEVPEVQSQDCSEGLAGAYVRVYDGGDRNRKRVNLNLNRPPLNTGEERGPSRGSEWNTFHSIMGEGSESMDIKLQGPTQAVHIPCIYMIMQHGCHFSVQLDWPFLTGTNP